MSSVVRRRWTPTIPRAPDVALHTTSCHAADGTSSSGFAESRRSRFPRPNNAAESMPQYPQYRPRRLRRTPALRALVRETHLHPAQLVLPLFVRSGAGVRRDIGSMPGVSQSSVDEALRDAERAARAGVGAVILFGIPDAKDATGSSAWPTSARASTPITGTAACCATATSTTMRPFPCWLARPFHSPKPALTSWPPAT